MHDNENDDAIQAITSQLGQMQQLLIQMALNGVSGGKLAAIRVSIKIIEQQLDRLK